MSFNVSTSKISGLSADSEISLSIVSSLGLHPATLWKTSLALRSSSALSLGAHLIPIVAGRSETPGVHSAGQGEAPGA